MPAPSDEWRRPPPKPRRSRERGDAGPRRAGRVQAQGARRSTSRGRATVWQGGAPRDRSRRHRGGASGAGERPMIGGSGTTLDARVGDRTDTARRIRAIVASASGNLVEWYDFYVYSFTALYFAGQFFPGEDQTSQLLNAAGVFAAGFLMRPLGGWLFGRLADRH